MIGRSSFRFPHTSNAGLTFFISYMIASHQRVSPFLLSILTAYYTVFDNLSPSLWVFPVSLRLGYYTVSFIQHVFSPPYELWLPKISILNRVLCHMYRIQIVVIFKFVPCSTAILPLYADFPYYNCIFLCLVPFLVMTNASCCGFCVPLVLVLMMDLISTNMLPS